MKFWCQAPYIKSCFTSEFNLMPFLSNIENDIVAKRLKTKRKDGGNPVFFFSPPKILNPIEAS